MQTWNLKESALLLIDLQNDFLHPEGAYGRNGLGNEVISSIPERLLPLIDDLRRHQVPIISTQFTLVPTANGPLMADKFKKLRPFLGTGDFCPGAWGHEVVESLKPVDFVVEKVAYSAFYQSRLEFILQKMGIKNLLVSGIVTNGGVASTVRDAHTRGLRTIVLEDGCAAFQEEHHQATITSLGSLVETRSIDSMRECCR